MLPGILVSLLAGAGQKAVEALTADSSPETKALVGAVSGVLAQARLLAPAGNQLASLQAEIDSKMVAMNREADELAGKLGDEPAR